MRKDAGPRSSPSEYDCRACGACCADGRLVEISKKDKKRAVGVLDMVTGREALAQVEYAAASFCPSAFYDDEVADCFSETFVAKTSDHRCVHLSGAVGNKVSCDVYANRPGVCRTVKPGDHFCLISRAEMGMEPL